MPSGLIGLRSALFSGARAEAVSLVLSGGAPLAVMAVRYDREAEPSLSAARFRSVQFEVQAADLPVAPKKADTLTAAGITLKVIQVEEQPGTGSWLLTVES